MRFKRLIFYIWHLPFYPRVIKQPHYFTKPHLAALSYGENLPKRVAGLNPHFRKLELVDDLSVVLVQPTSQAFVADAAALL